MAFRGPARRYEPPTKDTEYLVGAIDRMIRQRPTSSPGFQTDLARMQSTERTLDRVQDDAAYAERRNELLAGRTGPNAPREDDARFERLLQIPSMTREQASRLAYGGKTPPDKDDSTELRQRLAAYMQQPSREAAVAAVRAGANLNIFPDKFAGERGYQPEAGTPEAYAAMEQELQWKAEMNRRYGTPPKPTERRTERVVGKDGFYYLIDSQTGQVIKTGLEAPPKDGSTAFGSSDAPPSAVGGQGASALPRAVGGAPSAAAAPSERGEVVAPFGGGVSSGSPAGRREFPRYGPPNPQEEELMAMALLKDLLKQGYTDEEAVARMRELGYNVQ